LSNESDGDPSTEKGDFMKCPADCDTTLVMAERQGVEIDYCPTCRGVWLDRGELDKIIERDNAALAAAAAPAPPDLPPVAQMPAPPQPQSPPAPQVRSYQAPYPGSPEYGRGGYGHEGEPYGRKKKKRGFLDDLFDFG
jgi:Zn-finger nucleic acid-binding protein